MSILGLWDHMRDDAPDDWAGHDQDEPAMPTAAFSFTSTGGW
jgi:hypothetical protein